jgi:hypothetical protein
MKIPTVWGLAEGGSYVLIHQARLADPAVAKDDDLSRG